MSADRPASMLIIDPRDAPRRALCAEAQWRIGPAEAIGSLAEVEQLASPRRLDAVVVARCAVEGDVGEALLKLRRAAPRAAVIFIAPCGGDAAADVEDAARCLRHGADDYLPGPVTAEHLALSLERVAYQRSQSSRQRQEQLGAILNTVVDAIITIDEAGVIQHANPAAQRMFGYTTDEMVGRNVSMLMPAPYRQEHDSYIDRYRKTGVAKIIGIGREALARRRDGELFPIDLAVSEFYDAGRRFFTGIVRDISERKQLQRELADAVVEQQRRIARDLHDGLGGQMTGIAMLARGLQTRLERAGSGEAQSAAEVVSLIREAHEQLRQYSHGLMPVEVAEVGLQSALESLVEQRDRTAGPRCEFRCRRPVRIDSQTTVMHLYHIAHEALSNAIRHGGAKHVVVELSREDGHLTLSVTDDGEGIKPIDRGHVGLGLRTMRYRAELIGGTLSIARGPGGGTAVTCVLPESRGREAGGEARR